LKNLFSVMVIEHERHDEAIDPPRVARKQSRKLLSIKIRRLSSRSVARIHRHRPPRRMRCLHFRDEYAQRRKRTDATARFLRIKSGTDYKSFCSNELCSSCSTAGCQRPKTKRPLSEAARSQRIPDFCATGDEPALQGQLLYLDQSWPAKKRSNA